MHGIQHRFLKHIAVNQMGVIECCGRKEPRGEGD